MHIDAVKAVFPSRVLDNDEVVELVRQHSAGVDAAELDKGLAVIEKLLRISGAKTRRWLAEGETPLALIEQAVRGALSEAEVRADEVDLLIYVGIGKGFLEPGQSYLVAQALDMDRVECFDLLDACMSWTRAMQMADALLAAGRYRRILVVNGEINTYTGGPLYPCNYRLESAASLEWTLASFTIGGAATATLVSADDYKPWDFRFLSRPDLADLCTVPNAGAELFCRETEKVGLNGPFHFTSFGKALHGHAFEPCVELMRAMIEQYGAFERIFVHTSSYREWDKFAQALGVEQLIHHLYPEHGNLVSASIPAGIATAAEAGRIARGDRVAGWVGSAGMSFSAYTFTY